MSVSKQGVPQNAMEYIRGLVYYCCDAFTYSGKAGLTEAIVCDFNDDFLKKYENKKYDQEICRYCLCNGKVWCKI